MRPLMDTFFNLTEFRHSNECWPWIGYRNDHGYGIIDIHDRFGKRVSIRAHRLAWILANNKSIPDGLNIIHSCDNPNCVNPNHLSIGTDEDNVHDICRRGSFNKKLTSQDAREIRALRASNPNLTYKQIAERYGVHLSMVAYIVTGKCWRYA